MNKRMNSDYKYNPIIKRIAKLRDETSKIWGTIGSGESYRYLGNA